MQGKQHQQKGHARQREGSCERRQMQPRHGRAFFSASRRYTAKQEEKNKLDKSKIRQPQSHPFHRAQHADPAAASAQSANEGIDWHHARHVYNPELATQPAPSAPQQKYLHVSSIASFHASIVHTTKEHRPCRFAQHVHQTSALWGRVGDAKHHDSSFGLSEPLVDRLLKISGVFLPRSAMGKATLLRL